MFCGAGGLSEGFRSAGFDVRVGLDLAKHACATHEANFPEAATWCRDVREASGRTVSEAAGGAVDVVVGGPNCQGVSQRGFRNPDDPRNTMFPEFARLIDELQPHVFLMENVAGLTHRHNWPLLQGVTATLRKLGYRCAADVVRAADYGVPQLRHRFIMVGVRGVGNPVTFPAHTHSERGGGNLFETATAGGYRPHVTLRDAISDLPPVASGTGVNGVDYPGPALSDYQRLMRAGSGTLWNHWASDTAPVNLGRIGFVPEGGNWKDIPAGLLPPRFFQCRLTDHSTTYARPRWDHPSFTLTALFGNVTAGAFTHPSQDRAFTVREGARIHGFPDHFRFMGPLNSQYRQIGNAVPPLLAEAFARHIAGFLSAGQFQGGVAPRLTDDFVLSTPWDRVPVLTPRYRDLFGMGTRWPVGWGPEPHDRRVVLTDNYRLRDFPGSVAAE